MRVGRLSSASVTALLVVACAGSGTPSQVAPAEAAALPKLVSTDELARWQAAGPVVLLDVRTDVFAYLKGHLPGAEYLNSETLRAAYLSTASITRRRATRKSRPDGG